jgi:hypothetical protein
VEFQGTDTPPGAVPADKGLIIGQKIPLPVIPGFGEGGTGLKEKDKIPGSVPVHPDRIGTGTRNNAARRVLPGKLKPPGSPGRFGGKALKRPGGAISGFHRDKGAVEKKGKFPEAALPVTAQSKGPGAAVQGYG